MYALARDLLQYYCFTDFKQRENTLAGARTQINLEAEDK